MKVKIFCLFLCLFFLTSCKKSANENLKKIKIYSNNSAEYIYTKNGFDREFILCLPDDFEAAQSGITPLIFVLHGYGNTARGFMDEIHFEKAACSRGFAVCYVSGKSNPSSYNKRSCWSYGEDEWSKKDIENLEDLAKFLQKTFGFCSSKTCVVGFSNGAIMANKIAVEKSETFTAVVSVAGMMSSNIWTKATVKNKEKISAYFQINGTEDEVVPMRISKKSTYIPQPPFEEDVLEFISGKKAADAEIEVLSERTQLYKFNKKVWWALVQGETHEWPSLRWSGINTCELIVDFLMNQYE